MTISLTVGATTLNLNPDLLWADEFAWNPVEQTVQRTITGAQIVSVATRLSGREITLQPEDDSSAWVPHAQVEQLRQWAAGPGQVLSLTLRGLARDVVFRHQDGAMAATPVQHLSDTAPGDWYLVTLRFMEI